MSTQSDIAYEKIKELIFKMKFMPGDHIKEPQLSEMLGISRTPIHDAIRRLEGEGLVVMGANRGALVREFDEEEIKEIGTLRLSQDILSAELASYYGSASDFDGLEKMAKDCEKMAKEGDIYGRIRSDSAFHMEITKIGGNQMLYRQQSSLYQQIHLIQISKYKDIKESLKQIEHHKPLVEAIRGRDMKKAIDLLCTHEKDFFKIDPYVLDCMKKNFSRGKRYESK